MPTGKSKIHQSEAWLRRKYVTQRLSEPEIAKEAGVDQATINRWLRRFNITRGPR